MAANPEGLLIVTINWLRSQITMSVALSKDDDGFITPGKEANHLSFPILNDHNCSPNSLKWCKSQCSSFKIKWVVDWISFLLYGIEYPTQDANGDLFTSTFEVTVPNFCSACILPYSDSWSRSPSQINKEIQIPLFIASRHSRSLDCMLFFFLQTRVSENDLFLGVLIS